MRSLVLVAVVFPWWVGCASEEPGKLPWKVTTTSTAIADEAVAFEAEIRRESCAGPLEYRDVFTDTPAAPPVLPPGNYAFFVRARAADCQVLGEGCEMITLPTDEECVEVLLRAVVGTGCAIGTTCEAGVCVGGPDAGLDGAMDAALDAALDATPRDSVIDTTVDTSSCAPCDDGIPCTRDRCDGDLCVHESVDDACDDGIPCTLDECSVTAGCSNTPRHALCDDTNECTDDACDPAMGCVNGPNSDPCDDGRFCNGNDSCSGGTCSSHSGNPCGATCVESSDRCRSDCDGGGFGTWTASRTCMGALVATGTAGGFVGSCIDFCEDTSETMGVPVDCCTYIGTTCYAYRGDAILYSAPSDNFATSCDY